MGDRQPFRFRFPWFSNINPPRPTEPPTRPPPPPSTRPFTSMAAPPQRPPFRPAGIAPTPQTQPPPPQPPVAPREAATQPPPPPPPSSETQAKPPSPPASSTTTQVRARSVPPSPPLHSTPPASSTTTQVRARSVPPSPPLHSTTRFPSVPQSPQKIKSPPRSATDESGGLKSSKPASPSGGSALLVVQPFSPPKKSQPTTREEPLQVSPLSGSTQLSSSSSQEKGPKAVVTGQPSQESQRKTEIIPESINGAVDTTTKSDRLVETDSTSVPKSPVKHEVAKGAEEWKKDVEELMGKETKPDPEKELMRQAEKKHEDRELVMQENKKDQEKELMIQEKKKDQDKEIVLQDKENEDATRIIMRPLAAALDSVKDAREVVDSKIQNIKRKQETQDYSSGKNDQIKTATSSYHPEDRSMTIDSHLKPAEANREPLSLNKGIKEDINKMVDKLALGQPKESLSEKPVSVVSLAGDNQGATMHIGSESSKKDDPVHIHRGYKSNPDESPYATTDAEGSSKGRNSKGSKEETPIKVYINSNTQTINNSIVFDSSVSETNPGVHIVFSIDKAEQSKMSTEPENVETRKSEISLMPAEKLTYEPNVRRRRLRGLFKEPSDSEPDHPQKPRHHGCRFSCGDKGKDKDVDVF